MVAVAQPRPEVDPPGGGPAGGLIAADLERALDGGGEVRRAAHVDVVPGKEAEQVRHVPVVRSPAPACPSPRAIPAAGRRCRSAAAPAARASRVHFACRSAIDAERARRLDRVAEQVAQDLLVHRRAHRQRRAERVRVLGRERRRGDEPVVRRLLDQRVEEELRRALQQRVDALADRRDRRCTRSDPRARSVSQAPPVGHMPHCGPSIGAGRAPQIGVVVRHPAAGAVHLARRARAGHRQVRHHGRQRVHRLGQVRRQRRPVVHLGVDVDGVLAAPRRRHALVPEALQVRRLRTGPRAGDEQVAAVLEVERGETGIVAVARTPRTRSSVGTRFDGAEIERDAVEQLLVVADVRGAQRVDALARGADRAPPRRGPRDRR